MDAYLPVPASSLSDTTPTLQSSATRETPEGVDTSYSRQDWRRGVDVVWDEATVAYLPEFGTQVRPAASTAWEVADGVGTPGRSHPDPHLSLYALLRVVRCPKPGRSETHVLRCAKGF